MKKANLDYFFQKSFQRIRDSNLNHDLEPPSTLPDDLQKRCVALLEDSSRLRKNLIRINEEKQSVSHELGTYKEKLYAKESQNVELQLGFRPVKFSSIR